MRIRTPLLAAAVMAALAAPIAGAQTSQKSGDGYVYAPTTMGSRNPQPFVGEPVASAAAGAEADAQRLNPIVEAMNADASLKGSKLTLVPDPDTEVLIVTGVTVTRDQMTRALEIAASGAGEGNVANAIQPEELVIATTPQAPEGEINPNAAQAASPAPTSASTSL